VNSRKTHDLNRTMPRRWAATAWVSLFLMLFNVVNAGAMGLRRMEAMADGQMPICSAHRSGDPDQHPPGPSQPASSDCCSCCLSMCCTGAAVPDSTPLTALRSLTWISLAFRSTHAFPQPSAPSVGGSARAPPVTA
jgi:hypothetical protein